MSRSTRSNRSGEGAEELYLEENARNRHRALTRNAPRPTGYPYLLPPISMLDPRPPPGLSGPGVPPTNFSRHNYAPQSEGRFPAPPAPSLTPQTEDGRNSHGVGRGGYSNGQSTGSTTGAYQNPYANTTAPVPAHATGPAAYPSTPYDPAAAFRSQPPAPTPANHSALPNSPPATGRPVTFLPPEGPGANYIAAPPHAQLKNNNGVHKWPGQPVLQRAYGSARKNGRKDSRATGRWQKDGSWREGEAWRKDGGGGGTCA